MSRSIERLYDQEDAGPSAASIARLESKLEDEKAQHRIERFFWVFAVSILTDCILFKFLGSGAASLMLALATLTFLTAFARWSEVPWVVYYLDRIFDRLVGVERKGGPADDEGS